MIPFRGRSVKRGEGAPGQALTYDIHKGPGRETARAGAPRWLPCSRRIVRRGGKAAGALGHGEMTHPCPAGQDMLPVRGFDAVCPCGAKALQSWRAGFWVVAGESRKSRRFARQERLAGAPGERKAGAIYIDCVSQTPQAAGPCSWACRRLCAQPPQAERIAACLSPARGADRRLLRANGTGRRHCRPGGLCPHPLKGPDP